MLNLHEAQQAILLRLNTIENLWINTRNELRTVRDWRVEAHLRFVLIDLHNEHKRLTDTLLTFPPPDQPKTPTNSPLSKPLHSIYSLQPF